MTCRPLHTAQLSCATFLVSACCLMDVMTCVCFHDHPSSIPPSVLIRVCVCVTAFIDALVCERRVCVWETCVWERETWVCVRERDVYVRETCVRDRRECHSHYQSSSGAGRRVWAIHSSYSTVLRSLPRPASIASLAAGPRWSGKTILTPRPIVLAG